MKTGQQPWKLGTASGATRSTQTPGLGAFTLVELLVVVSIIALLISVLLPSLRGARDQAKLLKCGTHLSQFGKAMNIYANEYRDAVPRGIWEVQQTGTNDEAREFYWELFWPYMGLPSAETYAEKVKVAPDAGVLHCPAYRLPNRSDTAAWTKARSYAVNEWFQPEPDRDQFGRFIYPIPLANLGNIRRPGETCYMADTTGDSRLARKDLALLYDPPPLGSKSDPRFNPRHRLGEKASILFLDSHVSAQQIGRLPPLDNPQDENEYYEAHVFWNGRESKWLPTDP